MSIGTVTTKRLDIGHVVSDALRVIKRRGRDLLLASLLLLVVPAYLSLGLRYVSHGASPFEPGPLVASLVVWLSSLVFHGGLFHLTGRELEGKTASLEDLLRVGFKVVLPMLGLTLLVFIAVEAGLILLVAPGVLLLLRWCVAGPALVTEHLGVFAAMKRSAQLTKGRRGAIFLALLVVLAVYVVIYGVMLALSGGLTGLAALTTMKVVTPASLVMLGVFTPALSVVVSIGFNAFLGALHHRLAGGTEGSIQAMAEVFA
jgi:hypothetical protein